MPSIELPSEYGYVIIGSVIVPTVGLMMMGGNVMEARKKYNVKYPNLYAVPGVHKDADAFNQIQRGHQNAMETFPSVLAMLLVGGLKHPLACAAGGVLWTIGRYLYMVGYTEDSNKRYGKGGAIHWIGFLTALISSGKLAYDLVNAK